MPYIKDKERAALPVWGDLTDAIDTPGKLNYVISTICDDYITDHGKSYTTMNEIVGVLECAKLELYRRVLAPYEDQKRHENGDVYSNA